LQIVEASGHHLLELINDILDLSKIEAKMFDFYPQPVSVDEFCRSCLSFVRAQAAKKSVALDYTPEPSISKIFADPRRLKQILVNLLINAVKFTPEKGHVTLTVDADPEEDLIRFSVIDDGIGIWSDLLKKAIGQGILHVLDKPFTEDELLEAILVVLRHHSAPDSSVA
jgi:signal transduction histidine kinase